MISMKKIAGPEGRHGAENRRLRFRLPVGRDELEALLRVRYSAYRAIPDQCIVPYSLFGIDLDAYDLFSHHLGVFLTDGKGSEKAAGYIRLVTSAPGPQCPNLMDIASGRRELEEKLYSGRKCVLPSIGYFPVLVEFFSGIHSDIDSFVEPSRLSIHGNVSGIQVISLLVYGAISYGVLNGFDDAILSAQASHVLHYHRYGFKPFRAADSFIESVGWNLTLVVRRGAEVEERCGARLARYKAEIATTGRIDRPLRLSKRPGQTRVPKSDRVQSPGIDDKKWEVCVV